MYGTCHKYYTFEPIEVESKSEKKEHFSDTDIVNLILYNSSPQEEEMKDVLTSYIETYPSVKFYFITLREQVEDIMIEDHIMYINGNHAKNHDEEGILYKTIKAMEYCQVHLSYTLLVRSTISNIIDYTKLVQDKVACRYIEYNKHTLRWLDVTNDNSFGTYNDIIVIPFDTVGELLTHKYDWAKIL